MTQPTPEVGRTYKLAHSRKGQAIVKILAISGEWIDVKVVSGELRGISSVAGPGETERVRDAFCKFGEE